MQENKIGGIRLVKAVIFFILTFVASAFLFATVMYFIEGGYEYSPLFATLSLAVGCFVTAWYLGNTIGEKGIIIGLIVGCTVFIITAIVSMLVNGTDVSLHLLLRFIILLLASLIGAIIGVNKKANKKFI